MPTLSDVAAARQAELDRTATDAASRVVRLWATANPSDMDAEWSVRAPQIESAVTGSQVAAARQSGRYVTAATGVAAGSIVVEAFGGATREGRGVAPELFSGVTYSKSLIGHGMGVGDAFRAGTALMSILAANIVRDAGRSADATLGVAKGAFYSVRVVQPGACSRCAILAGVKGYRTDFERHPGCRCTSMPLRDTDTPEGFFRTPEEYFESLSAAEQDRVFTKSGAWAIRNGADPAKVVNARRGAYKSSAKRPDGTYSPARLRPVTIGRKADGSPLQVYATLEGNTARGSWGRRQNLDVRNADDRYRRTSTLRLMPEQIMTMSQNGDDARHLLQRYGYIN